MYILFAEFVYWTKEKYRDFVGYKMMGKSQGEYINIHPKK
jgi:hypothetical protein